MSERGRKAGLKSGEARRERKRMREWAEVIGDKKITITNADGTKETVPYDAAIISALYQKAIMEKDARAAELIMKLKGELEEKVTLDGKMQGITVSVGNAETAEKLEKILNK